MLRFLSKHPRLRSSPPISSPPAAIFTSSSIYRLFSFSTATPEAPSPSPSSTFAVQYLIHSCGLPSDKAVRAARYIPRLNSPHKPDAVLQFLRQAGITEPYLVRNPTLLTYSLEKRLFPRNLVRNPISVETFSSLVNNIRLL